MSNSQWFNLSIGRFSLGKLSRGGLVGLLILSFCEGATSHPWSNQIQEDWKQQYRTIEEDIRRKARFDLYATQAFRPESLILASDRDPLDVVLRRTAALLRDLKSSSEGPRLDQQEEELQELQSREVGITTSDVNGRFEIFMSVCRLRREIALSNPLLEFSSILFVKRHRSSFNHMCDQYYGVNAVAGGGIYVLDDPWGERPVVRNILANSEVARGRLKGSKLSDGSFLSPDLSFDGQQIAFAYVECGDDLEHRFHTDPSRGHWSRERSYHLFKVQVDGTELEQISDGTWNDFDPCWLTNGRIAFISERRGGYLRCGRVCPTYTLHDMASDGEDIRCLSPHETNEWHPSVDHNGRIVYTRWDYVDRHGCTAHQPWITTLDGRDARAIHGNFAPREKRPDMELDVRAVPGSNKYVATAAPHHGQAFGSIVLIDPKLRDDDAMSPVIRLTPDVAFPETQGGAQVYGSPWPLSEIYHLCVYDAEMLPSMGGQGHDYVAGNYGIYLVDAFGNKELLYRDPEISCLNPIPVRSREMPPQPAVGANRASSGTELAGTIGVVNVYDSLLPWPEGTKIDALRVFQVIPMSVPSGDPPHEIGLRLPTGADSVILARYILGTVPVEEDGSAYFKAPAKKELFFQALDETGLAVQSMRSSTYLQPGESLTCQGCHEPRHQSPAMPVAAPKAFRRKPSEITPSVDGTNPFSYPRLVQPVLDAHCLDCHERNRDTAPRLDREVIVKGRNKWFASYHSLAPEHGFWNYGQRHRTTPGQFGARRSKLYQMLLEGHYDVDLAKEDLMRVVLWLDSCSIFYGVYEKEGGEAQLRGEIVRPTLE